MPWKSLNQQQRVAFAKEEYGNYKVNQAFKIKGTGKIGYIAGKVNDPKTGE